MLFQGLFNKEKETYSVMHDGKRITITENGRLRILKCNGIIFSKIAQGSLYTEEYWDFFIPLAYLYPNPRILMIGLGGGTIAYQLSNILGDSMDMEIVDIDAWMKEAYMKFLGGKANFRIEIADGAEYVSSKKSSYDIVILDAYDQNGLIPMPFQEKKFITDAYDSIKDQGILAVNCIGSMIGPGLEQFIQRLSELFEVYRLDTSYRTANIVLVCLKNISKDEVIGRLNAKMGADKEKEFLLKAYASSKRVFITL